MAKQIQAYSEFGPRLEPIKPVRPEDIITQIVLATNQSRGSVKAVLDELDNQIEIGLRRGAVVRLPNGTHYRPIGKVDGTIKIHVRTNPRVNRFVNALYEGGWLHGENIGKNADEIAALWNEAHPDDPIEP